MPFMLVQKYADTEMYMTVYIISMESMAVKKVCLLILSGRSRALKDALPLIGMSFSIRKDVYFGSPLKVVCLKNP